MSTNLAHLAQQIGLKLKNRGWKLATAESCTGGGVAFWVTSIPGSSVWFERGFVTYSNVAKQEMLGVQAATLASTGAVSEATAQEMAVGALSHSSADVSLAITGIAGPDGGTLEKPVGTVCFAWAGKTFPVQATTRLLAGDRAEIREASMEFALEQLLEFCG